MSSNTGQRWKRGVDRVDDEVLVSVPGVCDSFGVTLFFGGDVQDLKEGMLSRAHAKTFAADYSLESVCRILRKAYDSDTIMVVRPTELHDGIYSCFSSWLDCTPQGDPLHSKQTTTATSLPHLERILHGSLETRIRLIGFSKGCIVLNQILYELSSRAPDTFTSRISNMIWLDGGHGGQSSTWITDTEVLQSFRDHYPDMEVDVRVTPYQVISKPLIALEESIFSKFFMRNKHFQRKIYFEKEIPSLEAHFRVIQTLV